MSAYAAIQHILIMLTAALCAKEAKGIHEARTSRVRGKKLPAIPSHATVCVPHVCTWLCRLGDAR